MQRILALIYPNSQEEPIVISLPKAKSSFKDYLGDNILNLHIFGNYHLYIGKKNSRKNNRRILLAKQRNGKIESLNFNDMEYIKERKREIEKVVMQLQLKEEKKDIV